MKVLIYINNLKGTGGPRVMLNLGMALISKGHEVCFLLDDDKDIAYELPDGIKFFKIEKGKIELSKNGQLHKETKIRTGFRKYLSNTKIIRKTYGLFKKSIKKNVRKFQFDGEVFSQGLRAISPDVILNNNVVTNYHYQEFFEKVCTSIICLHSAPRYLFKSRKISFKNAERFFKGRHCISVSQDSAVELQQLFPEVASSGHIYNIVDKDYLINKSKEVNVYSKLLPKRYVIYMGTLCERKRVDRIVKSLIFMDKSVSLVICGEGPLQKQLIALGKKHGVFERMKFLGFVDSPFDIMSKAECLILSSTSEGLPTVLIESLMLETPVISTDCKTGPREIMIGKLNRFLVSEKEEEKIPGLIADKFKETSHLTKDDFDIVKNRFSSESIVADWEKLFEKIGS